MSANEAPAVTPAEPVIQSEPHSSPLPLAAGLVCVVLIGATLRPGIVSTGPLLASIQDRFGLSHAAASLLTAIPDVLMGLLAAPAPWLAYRFGRDRVILAALLVLLAATVARAFAGEAATLFLSTAGIGAGIAIAGALIGGFIKASFSQKAPFLIGIYTAALASGSTLAAAASGPIAALGGSWRFGSGIWAILSLFAIAAWIFVETRGRRGARAARSHYRLPYDKPKAWLIGLFFGANNFLFYSLVAWTAPLYRERGMDQASAGLVLASFTASFIVAPPLAGLFSRRSDRRPLLAGFSTLALLGIFLLTLAPGAAPFLLMPVISFGLAGGFSLGMTLPLDNTHKSDEANAWSAFAILVAYLTAATGPLLVGTLRDLTGGFSLSLWMLVGACTVMLALTPFLHPRRARP
jgi:CP family cyanate transporter-like MFS transporter